MNGKGQVSIEFIIVILMLLALFMFSLGVFAERNAGYIHSREQFEAKVLAEKLARTINAVHTAGNGTEAAILLEKNGDFNVTVSGNAVNVEWRDNFVDSALLTDNVTINSLTLGNFVNVKNVSGGIEIENA